MESNTQFLYIVLTAFDFLNSNEDGFDIAVWYKSVFSRGIHSRRTTLLRIPRSVNLVYI